MHMKSILDRPLTSPGFDRAAAWVMSLVCVAFMVELIHREDWLMTAVVACAASSTMSAALGRRKKPEFLS
jgi:hypothetical protein